MKTTTLILAANDAETTTTLLANATEQCSPFAILQGDSFFVPYGNFPHKLGKQVFDKAAAEKMAANHNGLGKKLVNWALGGTASYPVYIGHPDLPGSKDTDKKAYGWVENMIPEETGMRLPVKWSSAGRELVENGHFRFYSPLWWTRPVRGGIQPVSFKSMGLTNDPNIPVPALANEAEGENAEKPKEQSQTENENENEDMNPELMAALGLEDGASVEDAIAKVKTLKIAASEMDEAKMKANEMEEKAKEAENAKAESEKKANEATEKMTENEAALAEVKEKIVTFETALSAAANAAVDAAVKAGKLTPAEKDGKVTELLAANDFSVALKELHATEAKVKTESKTGDLGTAKCRLVVAANDDAAAAREERAQLVQNEFQNTNPELSTGERKRIAWQRAQAKHPEAFGKKESSGAVA